MEPQLKPMIKHLVQLRIKKSGLKQHLTPMGLVLMGFFITVMPLSAQERLVLSTVENSPIVGIIELVVKEAYRQIGIEIEIYKLPPQRALVMSNNGQMDGELFRIEKIDEVYRNLLRIPIPVYTMEGVAATKNEESQTWDPSCLKPFRAGRIRGILWAEQLAKGHEEMVVNNYDSLIGILRQDRVDLIFGTRIALLDKIMETRTRDIRILEPPVIKIKLYHYLHKKRQVLLPRITEVLQKMEDEGRIKQIETGFLSGLKQWHK